MLLFAVSHTWLVRVRDPLFYTRLAWLTAPAASTQPGRSVLFLGTSRFQCGVRAQLIERHLAGELSEPVRVANWGTGGHGAFRSMLARDRLERLGYTPELLLIEVLPAVLVRGVVRISKPVRKTCRTTSWTPLTLRYCTVMPRSASSAAGHSLCCRPMNSTETIYAVCCCRHWMDAT